MDFRHSVLQMASLFLRAAILPKVKNQTYNYNIIANVPTSKYKHMHIHDYVYRKNNQWIR